MRTFILIIAWVLIAFSAICVLGGGSNTISALNIFQTLSMPWMANIQPIIAGIGNELFGLSSQSGISFWISAAFPLAIGFILFLWPKPNR